MRLAGTGQVSETNVGRAAGRVPMRMQLIIRFGYGLSVPWVQRVPGGIVA